MVFPNRLYHVQMGNQFCFHKWNYRLQFRVNDRLLLTVVNDIQTIGNIYTDVFRLQYPVPLLVNESLSVAFSILYNTEVVVEHIPLHIRGVQDMRVKHHISFRINELDASVNLHRCQSFGGLIACFITIYFRIKCMCYLLRTKPIFCCFSNC